MNADLLLVSLDEMLVQGERLLQGLSDQQYAATGAFGASIGAHYRHNLEHFKTMFASISRPMVDYDDRARDARIENERELALQVTRDFRQAARFLTSAQLEKPVQVECKTSYADPGSSSASSTAGREVMYAISHAVHHYALIGVIAGLRNIPVPENFGVAPSTIRHQKQKASA